MKKLIISLFAVLGFAEIAQAAARSDVMIAQPQPIMAQQAPMPVAVKDSQGNIIGVYIKIDSINGYNLGMLQLLVVESGLGTPPYLSDSNVSQNIIGYIANPNYKEGLMGSAEKFSLFQYMPNKDLLKRFFPQALGMIPQPAVMPVRGVLTPQPNVEYMTTQVEYALPAGTAQASEAKMQM